MRNGDSRSALVALVDEVSRLNGRLKSVFAETRKAVGLGESEMMVLTAVAEADRAPTVPQIGRSLGFPRQIVQRAANALVADGLVEAVANPDHKRAVLLIATSKGLAIKAEADKVADAIAARLTAGLDLSAATRAVVALRETRLQIEQRLREGGC